MKDAGIRLSKIAILGIFLLTAASRLVAQESWDYLGDLGSPAFSETVPVELGFLNLASGNLHLEIPLAAPPERGSLGFNARFVYDSRVWIPNLVSGQWVWTPLQGSDTPSYSDPNAHLGWDVFTDYEELTGQIDSPAFVGRTIYANTLLSG